MIIKPKDSKTVIRHPASLIRLPAFGGRVPDSFGIRRVYDGDATEITKAELDQGRAEAREAAKAPAKADPKPSNQPKRSR